LKPNLVRQKIKAGEATIGSFMGLGSPHVAGLMAHAGYDWLVIETEHNAIDVGQVEHMLMEIGATDTVPIVRVPPKDPIFIQRVLDIGAKGIVYPLIKTAEDAAWVVSQTRYPPEGVRGFGPLRASNYNHEITEYFDTANDNIIVSFIIETKEAVENIEEIASVPGVDGFFMGQCDLSLSMGLGHPMKFNEYQEIEDAVGKVLKAAKKNGVGTGMNVPTPESLIQRRKEGHTLLSYGPEYAVMMNAIAIGINAFRDGS